MPLIYLRQQGTPSILPFGLRLFLFLFSRPRGLQKSSLLSRLFRFVVYSSSLMHISFIFSFPSFLLFCLLFLVSLFFLLTLHFAVDRLHIFVLLAGEAPFFYSSFSSTSPIDTTAQQMSNFVLTLVYHWPDLQKLPSKASLRPK